MKEREVFELIDRLGYTEFVAQEGSDAFTPEQWGVLAAEVGVRVGESVLVTNVVLLAQQKYDVCPACGHKPMKFHYDGCDRR